MSAPSPILTRAYSELASGMVKFHDCLKIARIAVPFPYSQDSGNTYRKAIMVSTMLMLTFCIV